MSGRSAKEAMERMKSVAKARVDRVREIISGGDPKDAAPGGMTGEAAKAISGRQRQLDRQIEESGG
jgi:hypothetical protein